MMFKKKTLASAMATALVAGAMVSGGAQAMRISETGQGQALLGPVYFADSGNFQSTRVRIVNTNLTNAVKGRLVFRSKIHSDECLDMIVYLSPGDVAYVDVKQDPSNPNNAIVTSDDDSVLGSKGPDYSMQGVKFASESGYALTAKMTPPRTDKVNDTCAMGHVEVTGLYAAQGSVVVRTSLRNAQGSPVSVFQGMSKYDLFRIFETPKSELNALNTTNGAYVANGAVTNLNNATAAQDAESGANHAERVQLKATAEINNQNDRILVPFTALRDGVTPVGTNTAYGNNWVITNPTLDSTAGKELNIATDWLRNNNLAMANTKDALYDLDNALSTSALNGFYVNEPLNKTSVEITFPTKYRHMVNQYTPRPTVYNSAHWYYLPPFNVDGLVGYSPKLFDNQENTSSAATCFISPCPITPTSTIPHEVNFFPVSGMGSFNPTSGWLSIGLFAPADGVNGTTVYGSARFTDYAFGEIPAIGFMLYDQNGRAVTDVMTR